LRLPLIIARAMNSISSSSRPPVDLIMKLMFMCGIGFPGVDKMRASYLRHQLI
jgi:hypothetical protein